MILLYEYYYIDVKTNYEDEERIKLEEFVSANKHILEPEEKKQ